MRRISWFDIKTKFKQIIRSIFYTGIGQEFLCYSIIAYIKLIHYTSKVTIVGGKDAMERWKNNQSAIIASWHHQLAMTPFIANHIRKVNKTNRIASLASKHGDGRFVGKLLEKFGVINIAGSSRDNRKSGRGIDMHGLKEIFRALKNHLGIAITPDGPRGPTRKINGEVIKIASLSGSPIVPVGIGYSKYFTLRTWDELKIPLPFGAVKYYYGDLFFVDKNVKEQDIAGLNSLLEEKINSATTQANKF